MYTSHKRFSRVDTSIRVPALSCSRTHPLWLNLNGALLLLQGFCHVTTIHIESGQYVLSCSQTSSLRYANPYTTFILFFIYDRIVVNLILFTTRTCFQKEMSYHARTLSDKNVLVTFGLSDSEQSFILRSTFCDTDCWH